jgi:hypothetical protein
LHRCLGGLRLLDERDLGGAVSSRQVADDRPDALTVAPNTSRRR